MSWKLSVFAGCIGGLLFNSFIVGVVYSVAMVFVWIVLSDE